MTTTSLRPLISVLELVILLFMEEIGHENTSRERNSFIHLGAAELPNISLSTLIQAICSIYSLKTRLALRLLYIRTIIPCEHFNPAVTIYLFNFNLHSALGVVCYST